MEVIRQILLEIETTDKCMLDLGVEGEFQAPFLNNHESILAKLLSSQADTNPELTTQSKSKIYNYGLLVREGWVEEDGDMAIKGLSWDAHDFLAAIQEDSHWNRVKRYVKDREENVTSLPIATIRAISEKVLTEFMLGGG